LTVTGFTTLSGTFPAAARTDNNVAFVFKDVLRLSCTLLSSPGTKICVVEFATAIG
jgi:hypothetical protein